MLQQQWLRALGLFYSPFRSPSAARPYPPGREQTGQRKMPLQQRSVGWGQAGGALPACFPATFIRPCISSQHQNLASGTCQLLLWEARKPGGCEASSENRRGTWLPLPADSARHGPLASANTQNSGYKTATAVNPPGLFCSASPAHERKCLESELRAPCTLFTGEPPVR